MPRRPRARGVSSPAVPEPPLPPRLSLVILAVDDLARAVAFYREAFGWSASVETPVYVELALPAGMRLGLYAREGFTRNTGVAPARVVHGAITATELYVTVDDLDAAIVRLESAEARCLSPRAPRPWGDEAAYFTDSEGNVVVVARALA